MLTKEEISSLRERLRAVYEAGTRYFEHADPVRVDAEFGRCSHVVIATFEPLCGKETVEVLGWQKHVFAVCG